MNGFYCLVGKKPKGSREKSKFIKYDNFQSLTFSEPEIRNLPLVFMRLKQHYFLISVFLLLMIYMVIQMLNGRFEMHDFQVYYRTAARIAGGQNLYRIAEDGFYMFKYSPVSAVYFIPLSWVPLPVAKVIYWMASSASFCFALYLVFRMGEDSLDWIGERERNMLYLISMICMGAFLELEIHLGQVNIFILLLLLGSCFSSIKGKPFIAGILLALSIFIKPFGLVILGYFIYRKKYTEVIVFTGSCIILFFLPLFWYGSMGMLLEQNRLWLNELLIEFGNDQDILTPETHTVFSVVARYTPLRWIEWTAARTLIFQAVILVIIGLLFILLRWRRKPGMSLETYELALLFSMVPLTMYTNRNLYLFTLLSLSLLLIGFNRLKLISRIFFIAGILMSCFNIIEIWGPDITAKWEALSLISVGTLIMWIVLYAQAFKVSGESRAHP